MLFYTTSQVLEAMHRFDGHFNTTLGKHDYPKYASFKIHSAADVSRLVDNLTYHLIVNIPVGHSVARVNILNAWGVLHRVWPSCIQILDVYL